MEGYGEITYKAGVPTEDEFGIIYFENFKTYKGNFKQNKRNGNGVLVYSNGDEYNGEWLNNEKNGK